MYLFNLLDLLVGLSGMTTFHVLSKTHRQANCDLTVLVYLSVMVHVTRQRRRPMSQSGWGLQFHPPENTEEVWYQHLLTL